jgi:cysteine desulfurase/selenocysteine lyase
MTATESSPSQSAAPLDPYALRGDFPILSTVLHGDRPLVFLDNAASTQRPRQVIECMVDVYEKYYANVHRGIHWLSEQSTDLYEQSRERTRRFIGAEHLEEVIFTSGTTAGINLVARSWGDANLRPGDEIVLSVMEHHSNLVPWQQLAERTGAVLRHIPMTDDGLLILEEYDKLLGEKTRLVAVTAISNVLGTINPIDEITRRAHDAGALMLVDAAQEAPHQPIDVRESGVDFLAFSGHKMLGHSGIGILWGRRELLEAMPPFLGGGSMINDVQLDRFTPAELPAKFEAGTPPIVPAIALAAAIEYLEQVGLSAIEQHEQMLTRYCHDLLDGIAGVSILGPSLEHKAGIVSFLVDGVHAHDVAQVLDRQGVAVRAGHHCAQPLHQRLGITASTRASFYLYNTREDVDHLGDALSTVQSTFRRGRRRRSREQ